jgi:hypothetical protein
MPRPAISFCTTCHNRAYQLKQVFAANAAIIAADPTLEWVILNYASDDDLDEFLRGQLPQVSRRIVYAHEKKSRPWHASIAKNMAHRLATGAVLMNLDCDNYIANAPEIIRAAFADGTKLLHLRSKVWNDGTFGRIAMTRKLFHALGGYDESFLPMTHQDLDLLKRAILSGLGEPAWIYHSPPGSAIFNTRRTTLKHCSRHQMTWTQMRDINRAKSARNLAAKNFVANAGTGWCRMNPVIMHGLVADRLGTRRASSGRRHRG